MLDASAVKAVSKVVNILVDIHEVELNINKLPCSHRVH
jgi:hypothetical protein